MPDSAFCHLYLSCAGFTVSHHSHQPSFQPLKTKFMLHFREHCKTNNFGELVEYRTVRAQTD